MAPLAIPNTIYITTFLLTNHLCFNLQQVKLFLTIFNYFDNERTNLRTRISFTLLYNTGTFVYLRTNVHLHTYVPRTALLLFILTHCAPPTCQDQPQLHQLSPLSKLQLLSYTNSALITPSRSSISVTQSQTSGWRYQPK